MKNIKKFIFICSLMVLASLPLYASEKTINAPLLTDSVKMGFTTYPNIDLVISNFGFTGTDIKMMEKVDLVQRKDGKYESSANMQFNFFSVVRTPLLYTLMLGATPLADVTGKGDSLPVTVYFDDKVEALHVSTLSLNNMESRTLFTKKPNDPSVTKFSTSISVMSDLPGNHTLDYQGQIYVTLVTDKTYFH